MTLRDGSRVVLRPIGAADKELLSASFERLSSESRYRRFFTNRSRLCEDELQYLVDVDHYDHEAVVAIDRGSGELIGVARYIRSPDDFVLAEVAVTVADPWQGRGLGRALLGRSPTWRVSPASGGSPPWSRPTTWHRSVWLGRRRPRAADEPR